MSTFVPPQENISFSALKYFSATSSYFSRFFGGTGNSKDCADDDAKFHEEAKRLLADHPSLSKSLITPDRTFLDYMPFINPFIRGFNPNLLRNEGNNTALPIGEQRLNSYKTVMCEAWLITATCGYGNSCRFAHGLRELRRQSDENFPKKNSTKYHTKICFKYTNDGLCCHGPACLFLHPLPTDPKLFLAPLIASENGIDPSEDPASRECYLMSRSFYMDNHYFEDPYDTENVQPEHVSADAATSGVQANNAKPKVLDLVFDEHGNIIQHIVTSDVAASK